MSISEATAPPAQQPAPCVESFARLVFTDPFSLPASQQVEHARDLERHAAWVDSLRVDALAALAGPGEEYADSPGADEAESAEDSHNLYAVEDAIQDEVAATLRVSGMAAGRRIAVARDLHYKLPTTRRLLVQGVCSYAQAAIVSEECARLNVDDAREVEARALGAIRRQTPGQTRRCVRRAALAVCQPEPAELDETEFARREVLMWHDGGVMATITATLPAPDAMAIWNALTVCAHAMKAADGSGTEAGAKDNRTMAHKRADVLVAWAHQALDDPELPAMQGKKRLDTQVVIDLPTLLGLAENPGEIVGFGPIPASLARRLATESQTWRRLVTDPVTGHLLDYGTKTYAPPTALREYIIARDRTCQFPGCNRAGYMCDIDHVEPFTGSDEGGGTSADNLITLCRRHHRLKTHNHWKIQIVKPPDGQPGKTLIQWTSPREAVHTHARPTVLGCEPADTEPTNAAEPSGTDPAAVDPAGCTDLENQLASLPLLGGAQLERSEFVFGATH